MKDESKEETLEEFARAAHLDPDSLKAMGGDVAVLPLNIFASDTAGNLFPPFTKEIIFRLQSENLKVARYSDRRESRTLVLDSADIYLPIVRFIGEGVATVALGVLAAWIYDRWISQKESRGLRIHLTYLYLKVGSLIIQSRKIEGPASEVHKIVSAASKLFSEKTKKG